MEWVPYVISIIAVLSTFFAVWYGPKKQLEMLDKQIETQIAISSEQIEAQRKNTLEEIKTNILLKHRHTWINTLQEHITQYCASIQILSGFVSPRTTLNIEDFNRLFKEVAFTKLKILLLLDSSKKDQRELILKTSELLVTIPTDRSDKLVKEFQEKILVILTCTKKILDSELASLESLG